MTERADAEPATKGPTVDEGVLDTEHAPAQLARARVATAAQAGTEGATLRQVRPGRRRRGPVKMLRFRVGLLVRRWRQSLQFRAVTIAMVGALVIFLVTGAFLSHQISERLFNDRLEQVLTQSETDFTQVQASFDASDAADRDQLQTMVTATLDALDSDASTSQRRWLLIPLSSSTGQSMLPAQAESDWMTSATVPQELQNRVGNDGSTYWQSSSVRMDDGGQPVPVVIVGRVVEPQPGARYGLYLVNDFSQPQETLEAIHAVLILSTLVQALLVSGVVGYVTREVVRPVSTTARVSESLADGNLGVRMEVEGSHEVARLGRSFNRMADNLQHQITRLERLSSMQQTFVSDVSHELRTPLTTVRMAAEVLHNARDDFDPVNRRSAELLYNQVDRFDTLLADLLEISRFDAGAARLDISGTNVFALINEVLEASAPLAANSGSVVRVHSDLQRCIVQVDQRRIDRILRNLLVNALEHGEGGPIDVVVRASDVAVGIAVRDHGIGMTHEQTQKVFDRFWRADPARARTTGGTGLGLSIAVEDTRLHGGRLDAWGSPGEGACFRLTLPLLRSRPLTDEDFSPVDLPPHDDELPSVAVVTDTGTFAAVPLDRDSVMAPVTEALTVVRAAEAAEATEVVDEAESLEKAEALGEVEALEEVEGAADLDTAHDPDGVQEPAVPSQVEEDHGTGDPTEQASAPTPSLDGTQAPDAAQGQVKRPDPSILEVAGLDGPAARHPILRTAIGGQFLTNTAVSQEGVEGAYPSDAHQPQATQDFHLPAEDRGLVEPTDQVLGDESQLGAAAAAWEQAAAAPEGTVAAQDEVDDLDVVYEDLYLDDTGELPAFRDGIQDQSPPAASETTHQEEDRS
ncbi:MtrAB system histidine kinase MtrB [Kocuria sp.]|uniref:MtrAB system histidine kinase MtrB n=1 Tax=Kocuria sp. TaxID=1871328 RepID=UPI0026DF545E|nr:MtrAB system histidine kinase MtrB [Kocuria sp.]MDO5619579.1 MtrAB system histidine kinase MtrB [Kocuria sp.]